MGRKEADVAPPGLRGAGQNDRFRWMEVAYIAADRSASLDELRRFFKLLEERRLFLLDVEGCSFLFRKGRLAVVDLESLFPVETTVADLVRLRTRKSAIELDEYEKQLRTWRAVF